MTDNRLELLSAAREAIDWMAEEMQCLDPWTCLRDLEHPTLARLVRAVKEAEVGLRAEVAPRMTINHVEPLPINSGERVGERTRVMCDTDCGAFEEPQTLEEYRATLEHYIEHMLYGGCAHGG